MMRPPGRIWYGFELSPHDLVSRFSPLSNPTLSLRAPHTSAINRLLTTVSAKGLRVHTTAARGHAGSSLGI
jgi:hypothetical protein